MPGLHTGVMVENLRMPFPRALEACVSLGVSGIQFYGGMGETDVDALSPDQRRAIGRDIALSGLRVAALCGELMGHGLERRDDNEWKVPKMLRMMDWAHELGADVMTTHIGVIPARECERRAAIRDALKALAAHAPACGVRIAIETGPETPEVLLGMLDEVGSPYIGVNLDPANLVMVTGVDPVHAVRVLAGRIFHTHAKDGVMLCRCDPETIYNFFAQGGIDDLRLSDYFTETPLGDGGVDFDAYIAALKAAGYSGFLTIERETGANPAQDIALAVRFLSKYTGR